MPEQHLGRKLQYLLCRFSWGKIKMLICKTEEDKSWIIQKVNLLHQLDKFLKAH